MQKAVFLDRDGTIIEDCHYIKDPKNVQLCPGAVNGLKLLEEHGFKLIIVSNQSGIGRGIIQMEEYNAVQDEVLRQLKQHGVNIMDSYYCPNHPTEAIAPYNIDCNDRKPRPGMLVRAIETYDIDTNTSFMIGDKDSDIRAGQAANIRSILVRTGYGTECASKPSNAADYIADTIEDAVKDYILK